MGTLCGRPLPISCLLIPNKTPQSVAKTKTHYCSNHLISAPNLSSTSITILSRNSTHFLSKSSCVLARSSSRNDSESRFFDDDGVVKDMDAYLNYLSLEYDSVWDTKPSWCQPWTISLTGVLVIASSWIFLHSMLITAIVIALIGAWWYIFLYSYPKAYSEMIAERRKNVTSGVEDTFGLKKSP